MSLNKDEMRHYQRQYLLEELGVSGQLKLKNARVVVVGAGGLGSPLLLYLAAAGVGNLKIIDFDKIESHNLHRQILFNYDDIGKLKAEVAATKLIKHNPNINLIACTSKLDDSNVHDLLKNHDIVVDGSDNFETRYAVSDACQAMNLPLVSGAIYKFEGQVAVFNYQGGPSYRDLFPNPPGTNALACNIVGALGTTCAVIAGLMSNEVIKLITGLGRPLSGSVLQCDLLSMSIHEFKINTQKIQ